MRYAWFLAPALVAACGAPIPLWTADYAQRETTRSYAGVAPAQAIAAAEEVVKLAGAPRDVQVTPKPDGAEVHRYYIGFVGLHQVTLDYGFKLTAAATGQGSTVTLAMDASSTDNGDVPSLFVQGPLLQGNQIQIADPYRLFFARMDYLLGKRPDWVTCAEAPAKLGASVALDPLCNFAKDVSPPPRG